MRLLVLNVDRDDDLGRKTGIRAPILGREAMLQAATALAVADPEEADANGMFGAIKEFDEISARKLEYNADEVFVGAVTGHIREGSYADNAIAQQIDQIIAETHCDSVILVSDGNEDEHVLPILKTRVKVNGVKRIIIKQARNLEGALFLFTRLIHDEKLQRRFFLPLALLLIAAGVAIIAHRPEVFVAAGLFLGAIYIMVQVFSLEKPLGTLFHGIGDQMRAGKLSLFASLFAFLIVVFGGWTTTQHVHFNSDDGVARYTVLFVKSIYWYLVSAVILIIVGRGLDRSIREHRRTGRYWEAFLFVSALAVVLYGLLQIADRVTQPNALPGYKLINLEFLTWLFFGGFLFFTGLIARRYFQNLGRDVAPRSIEER